MEENNQNKENVVNTEELKKEATDTVNQVKETIKNVDIKKETIATKGFVTEMFKNPLGKINEIAKDNSNKNFKTALFILAIWVVVVLIKSVCSLSKYRDLGENILTVIKAVVAPVIEIVVISLIVFLMNKKAKKSLPTIISTMITAYVPVVIARVISLLTLISYNAYKITSPISTLCSIITIIFSYFAMKDLFEEKENSNFIKTFVIIEAIYMVVALIISYLGINI